MANTTLTLSLSILVAALTAFQFGYHSGVINQPKDAMSNCTDSPPELDASFPECIPMNDFQWGTFVALFLLGGMFGGLSGGFFATSYGRRKVIMWNNFTFVASGFLLATSPNVWQLYLGRVVAGFGAGLGTVVVPLYISEISPIDRRGAFGSLNQLSIVVGVLVSQVAGVWLSTREGWRPLLGLTVVPSLLQMILLGFAVESPKWLASRNLIQETRKSLSSLRGTDTDIEAELAEMLGAAHANEDVESARTNPRAPPQDSETSHLIQDRPPTGTRASGPPRALTFSELFLSRALRKPLLAAFGLQLIQQFSGINAAVYYSTTIFTQSYPAETAIKLTLLVSAVNLFMTLVSSSLIEKLGRRTLLLTAELGMSVSAFVVVLSVHANLGPLVIVGALMTFVGAFGLGLGAIPWLILPELVPSYALGPAASICTAINWTASFGLALAFPSLISFFGYDVFFLFGAILLGAIAFTHALVPETKGLSPEEVAVINHYN
ncbi:Solute carrier 2, facilitated glucose transporter member 3 [Phlyctochytrium planicorne]|nr:Solute carrier 2, facilitated glucose transporter member 3 [Phlyctochytrium planicorne]